MRLVVTRDDYFAAALEVLATRGHAALRIGALCRSLGVTAGSFYNYFGNFDAFVGELLACWQQSGTVRIRNAARAEPDPLARMVLAKNFAVALPHEAETAIRAWGHVNPAVARVQRQVDQDRQQALRAVIRGVVATDREADELAVMGLSLLVGIQQWRSPVDADQLRGIFDTFESLVMQRIGVLAG